MVFLLRIQDYEEPSLVSRLLYTNRDGEIQQLLQETREAGQALYIVNSQGLPFIDCLYEKTALTEGDLD